MSELNSSFGSEAKEFTNVPPIPLGTDFDITFDMTSDFPVTASKTKIPSSPPVQFSASQPVSPHLSPTKAQHNDSLLTGTTAPEVHRVEILSGRPQFHNQAPVTMERFASMTHSRPRTAGSSRPQVKAKTYVFGFREEVGYIPRPFISSHRPKTARARQRTAVAVEESPRRRTVVRAKQLSKRRELHFDSVDPEVFRAVTIGTFEQFTKQYKGP